VNVFVRIGMSRYSEILNYYFPWDAKAVHISVEHYCYWVDAAQLKKLICTLKNF